MIAAALEGRRVVRLKGGDPFVFGRGAEEALALQAAGVPFEVVPGVTSAVAAPALAGIPVTHRGMASGVVVLTGADAATCDAAIDCAAAGPRHRRADDVDGHARAAGRRGCSRAAGRPTRRRR